MDELDQNILTKLQNEGFQKSSALAAGLKVGERTIRRRLNNMRNIGLIRTIAMPNPILAGYKAWAKIGIKVAPGAMFNVTQELVKHPSAYFVAYTFGTFDLMIAVHFNTIGNLAQFVNTDLTKIKGILSTETMILTYPRKYYNFTWDEPAKNKTHDYKNPLDFTTSQNAYELDDIDFKILDIMMEDALLPVRVLKSKIGVGEATIRRHIKDMQKAGIFKIEVVPNPESIGYEFWATLGLTISHQHVHKVINDIIKNPAVYLASVSLGRFNIVISARFHNIDMLNKYSNKDLAEIPGISAIETFIHTKPLKYHSISW